MGMSQNQKSLATLIQAPSMAKMLPRNPINRFVELLSSLLRCRLTSQRNRYLRVTGTLPTKFEACLNFVYDPHPSRHLHKRHISLFAFCKGRYFSSKIYSSWWYVA